MINKQSQKIAANRLLYCEDENIHKRIVGKYIMLKLEKQRKFFKIINTKENKTDGKISKPNDSHNLDSRLCAILNYGHIDTPVFDFRKNEIKKPTQFVLMNVEGYGAVFEIGILFRDVTEIVGIAG